MPIACNSFHLSGHNMFDVCFIIASRKVQLNDNIYNIPTPWNEFMWGSNWIRGWCVYSGRYIEYFLLEISPDNKVHGANMGPIWVRQDPGGPHVGSMLSGRLRLRISALMQSSVAYEDRNNIYVRKIYLKMSDFTCMIFCMDIYIYIIKCDIPDWHIQLLTYTFVNEVDPRVFMLSHSTSLKNLTYW